MKRVVSFLLVVVALFTLTACGSQSKEPAKIELTKDNFENYFLVDASISDFSSQLKSSFGVKSYEGYANLKVTVIPKKEVKIEDVTIKGKVTLSGTCWTGNKASFDITLKLNGEAEYTKDISSGTCSMWQPENPTISRFYNYESVENEFLVNDEKILITSISGSIYKK